MTVPCPKARTGLHAMLENVREARRRTAFCRMKTARAHVTIVTLQISTPLRPHFPTVYNRVRTPPARSVPHRSFTPCHTAFMTVPCPKARTGFHATMENVREARRRAAFCRIKTARFANRNQRLNDSEMQLALIRWGGTSASIQE
ncbi:hypothetical protein CEXT_41301 [Caerostris extrusa]|uniref:Uncharacterized protein n=1 Tax=Caerostris extrusa TaxID=172846 RepID=A0AAV4TZC5_CAEEX|nr:hypothetical protein CEXT_41301 [Caerostris extrusa]